jgi:hypothetical protein
MNFGYSSHLLWKPWSKVMIWDTLSRRKVDQFLYLPESIPITLCEDSGDYFLPPGSSIYRSKPWQLEDKLDRSGSLTYTILFLGSIPGQPHGCPVRPELWRAFRLINNTDWKAYSVPVLFSEEVELQKVVMWRIFWYSLSLKDWKANWLAYLPYFIN